MQIVRVVLLVGLIPIALSLHGCSDASCGADGTGCALLADGGAGDGGDVHSQDPDFCETYLCPKVEKAQCPAQTTDCITACQDLGSNAAGKCGTQLADYFRCAEQAQVGCDGLGRPLFEGCEAETNALNWCIEGRQSDGGYAPVDVGLIEPDGVDGQSEGPKVV